MQGRKILLAEDEENIGEALCLNLEAEGYRVFWAQNGEEALDLWRAELPELIILDVMMPLVNGYEVCQRIRGSGDRTPILFLTVKASPEDRIHGLELGADDYLQKPFHLKELFLRIQALFRRKVWAAETQLTGGILEFGPNRVDFGRFEATGWDGSRDSMTQKECQLLKLLAEHAGQVVARDEILDKVWGLDHYPTPRTVDNFIARLRRRFEPDPSQPRFLHTVRGVGYRFLPEGENS